MYFAQKIVLATCQAIEENLYLIDGTLRLNRWPLEKLEARDRKLVQWLIAEGWLTEEEIAKVVEKALRRLAGEMFQQVMRGHLPDHVTSPSALAYGMVVGELDSRAVETVRKRLDHGETLDEFKGRAENLLPRCIEQLKAGPPPSVPWPKEVGTICHGCGE